MFVVLLSLAGSHCAQRSPCVVCHFPYDSVNDYPCPQRQKEESLPHGREIERTLSFSIALQNTAHFPNSLFISLSPYRLLCYRHVSSVRAPSASTFLLQVFTMAHLPHFLLPRFTDCLSHKYLQKLNALSQLTIDLDKII